MDNGHADHNQHAAQSHMLRNVGLGVGLVTGAVIVAPYILPLVGLKAEASASILMELLHVTTPPTDLAAFVNHGISKIPFVGSTLATHSGWNAVAVGLTGIGGVLLGRFIERKHNGEQGINWGKVIRYSALATSLFIALPAILTGVSVGVCYIASLIGGAELATSAVTFCSTYITSMGAMSATAPMTGMFSMLPHVLTCSLSFVPAGLAWLFSSKMDLDDDQKFRANIEIVAPPQQGKLCRALLTLSHADGKPVLADELATVHTQKLHLFVVDRALKDYHHLHPRPTGEPGVYEVVFTPHTSHSYSAWADVTAAKNNQNYKLRVDMPSASDLGLRPAIAMNNHVQRGDLVCVMKTAQPLQSGKMAMVEFELHDTQGKPVKDLQPIMGEQAHLVGFSENGASLIHCHPVGEGLRFHLAPEQAGKAKFFLQIRRGGEDIFLPFGQQVKPPEKKAESVQRAHTLHPALPAR